MDNIILGELTILEVQGAEHIPPTHTCTCNTMLFTENVFLWQSWNMDC